MKSRIKKLLAAALALCLIAAMVPGAALAADSGSVATINENNKEVEFKTLEDALTKAAANGESNNKTVTLNADYELKQNATLATGVTLIVPTGVTLTVGTGSTFSVNGTLELDGTIEVSRGNYGSVGQLNASVEIDTGNNSSIIVDGKVSFSTAQTINGELVINENGQVTASGIMTINGRADIAGELSTSNELRVSGSVDVSGTVSGSINVAGGGTITYSEDTTITNTLTVDGNMVVGAEVTVGSSAVTINGSLDVNDKLIEQKAITLGTRGVLTVSNGATAQLATGHSFASGTTSVENNGTLIVGDTEYVGDNSISGEVNVTTEDSNTVLVIPTGASSSVNLNKAYTIDKKLVVRGTLTIDSYTYISNELKVDGGTITVDSTLDFAQSSGLLTGDGQIDVSGAIYNKNNANDFGDVSVRMLSGGHVYSVTESIASNITSGQAVTEAAGDGQTYPYTVAYSGSGSFTITKGTVTGGTGMINIATSANANSTVNFSVSTTSGYVIDKAWYVRYGETTPNYVYVSGTSGSFPMPAEDITFYVSLKEAETPDEPTGTTYSISRITSTNGTFVVNANKADAGETVTITTSPNSGYKVSRVSVTGATATKFADNVYTFTMPAQNVTVSVTFERGDYTVSLTNYSYDDGYISLRSSGTTTSGNYAEGDEVTIYAFPDRGFHLRSLTITRTDNRQTVRYTESNTSDDVFYFTMPASNVTVRAYFTDGVYEITTDIDGRGSLAIRDENGNTTDVAEEGEEIRIYPSANNGYRLGDLYVTYTDSDDEDQTIYPEAEYNSRDVLQYYWFEMPEYDVEIYADFGEGDYVAWIDRNNIEHGSIRVSPNVADEDDTVSVYVTPDSGYQLDELVVEDEDGRDVSTTALASGTRYTFRMPDSDVTISATFRSRNYTSNFTDVPRTEWYYEAVSYVATEGLMNGVSTTQFNPNGTASRAQIVTILWRLAGEPSALTGAFTDVPAGEYYSTAVAWASRQGIVTGVGNNRFEPNSNITREQLAVILYRYAQDAGYSTTASGSITGYYDYARVNGYARTALQWAVGTGLITGTSSTTLSPQDTATRAQVATILMRFCENIVR